MTKKVVIYDKLLDTEIKNLQTIGDNYGGLTSMAEKTGLAKGTITNAMAGRRVLKDTADYIRLNILATITEPAQTEA